MQSLDQLPDSAVVLTYPIEPALSPQQCIEVEESLGKLLGQFEREATANVTCVSCMEDGHVLLIAYEENPGEGLSGCRKDKIAKVLQHLEEKMSIQILNAAPLLVKIGDAWQAHSRASIKELVAAGTVNLQTMAYDTRCGKMGTWKQGAIVPIADMWMRPIIERMLA